MVLADLELARLAYTCISLASTKLKGCAATRGPIVTVFCNIPLLSCIPIVLCSLMTDKTNREPSDYCLLIYTTATVVCERETEIGEGEGYRSAS